MLEEDILLWWSMGVVVEEIVFVAEEKDNSGWRKMGEALWESLQERKYTASHDALPPLVRNSPTRRHCWWSLLDSPYGQGK